MDVTTDAGPPSTGPVTATLDREGTSVAATADDVRRQLDGREFFWLDLAAGPPPAPGGDPPALTLDGVLGGLFGFHPLDVEDAEHFGQRPKVEDYDEYTYLVAHGAAPAGGTAEVHLFFSARFVVSVHRGPVEALDLARQRLARHRANGAAGAPQIVLVYDIVDALTDDFFPVLAAFDDRIDALESAILARPTDDQLGEIFSMKQQLMAIRKVVAPQRDVFAGVSAGTYDIAGLTDGSGRYFRDLYDHLIRIGDMVDSYRDLLGGVMDTHLSTVSNRLNVVMKQLAVIATVFLPLSFLTGFFGQNFGWMVERLGGAPVFFGAGIGSQVVAALLLMMMFKRRGWLGGPTT
ncbi:MAG: magnesium transporter CorA family protein [Acidimicrobiales bacterium]